MLSSRRFCIRELTPFSNDLLQATLEVASLIKRCLSPELIVQLTLLLACLQNHPQNKVPSKETLAQILKVRFSRPQICSACVVLAAPSTRCLRILFGVVLV